MLNKKQAKQGYLIVLIVATVMSCIGGEVFKRGTCGALFAAEITVAPEHSDPKTQEMMDLIKKKGLSLQPARYYETW